MYYFVSGFILFYDHLNRQADKTNPLVSSLLCGKMCCEMKNILELKFLYHNFNLEGRSNHAQCSRLVVEMGGSAG
jgi:hypothetical protein